jgi:hypothetical protein
MLTKMGIKNDDKIQMGSDGKTNGSKREITRLDVRGSIFMGGGQTGRLSGDRDYNYQCRRNTK